MNYQDQEFVAFLIKAIVSEPDKVKVDRTVDELGVLLKVDVAASDIGSVVGRGGNTVRAVRTLAKIVGAKNNSRVNIKLNEPEGSTRPPRRDYRDQQRPVVSHREEDLNTDDIDNFKI